MTKIIGLTGGIGSGKTTIAAYFETLGVPVFIADDEAKKEIQLAETLAKIETLFGLAVFEHGFLDRQKLAAIVFSNPEKRSQLNAIIHPLVKKRFQNWLLLHKNKPYVIYEAAILFESGSASNCDYIITVTAPLETRIERVMQRDQTTSEHVLSRIKAQWSDAQRAEKSDFIIENSDLALAKDKANEILKILNIRQNKI
jgi:dephospho-CoA kinase